MLAGPGRASSAGSADGRAVQEAMRGLVAALHQNGSCHAAAAAASSPGALPQGSPAAAGGQALPQNSHAAAAARQTPSEATAAAVMRVACALAERSPEVIAGLSPEVSRRLFFESMHL